MTELYEQREHPFRQATRGVMASVPTPYSATRDRVDLAERLLLAGHDHKRVAKQTGLRGRVVRLIAWRLFAGETQPATADMSTEISNEEATLHVA